MAEFFDNLLGGIWLRIFSALIVGLSVIVVWRAPSFEERFFPVIKPGSGRIVSHFVDADGWTNFRLTFHKLRDCRSSAEQTEWFWTDKDGAIGVLPWSAATTSHSPQGIVVSPALKVLLPDEAVSFMARVQYDCGLPWRVYATIGPFTLPLH